MADHKPLRAPAPATKMMLAFVIRQCEIDLGHPPTASELAGWANNGGRSGKQVSLFGRPISEREAQLILRRPGRLVSAKPTTESAAREAIDERGAANNVVRMTAARERLTQRPSTALRRRTRLKGRHK